jgi:hypothetical protein
MCAILQEISNFVAQFLWRYDEDANCGVAREWDADLGTTEFSVIIDNR